MSRALHQGRAVPFGIGGFASARMVAQVPSEEERRARKKRSLEDYLEEEWGSFDNERLGELVERRLKAADERRSLVTEIGIVRDRIAANREVSQAFLHERLRRLREDTICVEMKIDALNKVMKEAWVEMENKVVE
jgi:hypothetical protein